MGYLTVAMTDADRDADELTPLVQVLATPSAPEAEVVRGLLESDGIPVVLKGMSQGPYRMGATYVWVPAELEEQARAIIVEAQLDAERGVFEPNDPTDATR